MADAQERIFIEYLAASARAGSRIALEKLAVLLQPRLLAHARRLTGDADAAPDMVQEAWIEIIRGLPRLDDARAFPAWSYRIVSRRCARWIRSAQRRRRLSSGLAAEPVESVGSDSVERDADAARVALAMASLPPNQRAAIALFYLEDMSIAEIAVALDVPPGTVKTRLMHARDKLRDGLNLKETSHE